MRFHRSRVPLDAMDVVLGLWLLIALLILSWLLWTERQLVRKWITKKFFVKRVRHKKSSVKNRFAR